MSKAFVIFKREFEAQVRSKAFVIGTILGPTLMIGIFAFQFLMFAKSGGGEHTLAIVDASSEQIGVQVERALLSATASFPGQKPATFQTEVLPAGQDTAVIRAALEQRVAADSLDGYLLIPTGVVTGEQATYYGRNATSEAVTDALRQALQRSVQTVRLGKEGIDPEKVGAALQPVRMSTVKTDGKGAAGSAAAAQVLAMLMGLAIYMVVVMYGAGVLNAVLEEKRDRIVEVIVSSVRASQLLVGKVFGIGGAGLLQMLIWVLTVVVLVKFGPQIVGLFGVSEEKAASFTAAMSMFPKVPAYVTVLFLAYFLGGFFIFATMYAMLGSIATNNQEAQQLMFPVMIPLIGGFLMLQPSLMNPDSAIAVAGSIIPFTSPIIMPARSVVAQVPLTHTILSLALLATTVYAMIWIGAKIYRIGIFATGKRATWGDVIRWIRTA